VALATPGCKTCTASGSEHAWEDGFQPRFLDPLDNPSTLAPDHAGSEASVSPVGFKAGSRPPSASCMPCSRCNKTFLSLEDYVVHCNTCSPNSRVVKASHHDCRYCDSSFATSKELSCHVAAAHTNAAGRTALLSTEHCRKKIVKQGIATATHPILWPCPECDAAFPTKQDCECHAEKHVVEKISQLRCPDCGAVFASATEVATHRRHCTPDARMFACHDCNRHRRANDKTPVVRFTDAEFRKHIKYECQYRRKSVGPSIVS
jgi:uncharacterized C2H2 Zn-finger protein